jgi:branched-chain amino acid transport system substrate-binding protein
MIVQSADSVQFVQGFWRSRVQAPRRAWSFRFGFVLKKSKEFNMKRMMVVGMLGAALLSAGIASAQIKVGVVVSTTGAGASLGIPEKNAISMMPKTIGKHSVQYIVLDDASDTSVARRNAERLTTEEHVDIILGSSTSPTSIAMIEVAGRSKTPMISLGAALAIIEPADENKRWVFKTPYNDSITTGATVKAILASGAKTAGFIGFNDAYGESWLKELEKASSEQGLKLVVAERFNRTDTSVTAQVLKVMAAKPDVVIVVGSGTPSALPQTTLRERGYKGAIYQTTGVTNADFIRVGGKNVEGTLVAAATVTVAEELPANHPAAGPAKDFLKRWNAQDGFGPVNAFAGYAWDAYLIMEPAIVKAAAKATPGTAEFRAALRDGIEATKSLPTTNGYVTMSPTNHNGYSVDAPALITVKGGRWVLAK